MISWLSRNAIGFTKSRTLTWWTLTLAVSFVVMVGEGCSLPGRQLQEEANILGLEGKGSFADSAKTVRFGERYRQGDTISTAFVESTINQVVSTRFVKRQQMQWTPKGAYLLLQIRTRVRNDDLEEVFRGWYPRFRPAPVSPPSL